ncbi:hypothetical protein E4U43_004422 [Claviceps pusilla]|uniref:Uncharacterized protein n=1 Tax=Claviceps pusilla TaxID=123648 RepID=A0A9P7SZ88_9HYPO|nr:hypothetical protein E4U43_004422 [Claviceps pusilla]
MPAATTEIPAVALSFANNFWGKEDAGVAPLLERMQNAKTTCDELKSFYGARASIEEEYSRKLLNLSRKSLGSQETGTLKTSLDTLRGEVEAMAKQHQSIAGQMKTELEEPLAAFAGGMKERRKIVQGTVEKLLKTKIQQTQQVNKTRDKYEQECLKIKGYLAQGHMVMGQEERRNKAKLEKTQISLATANQEYESAVKILEETTARWNREWKAAADKFQDLEEERLDFTKSSLWTFANIASTVCVSDDTSCEKIRLSLENMEVEKDIIHFITERGTGQEIPDPPKYINFCRGDVNDSQSEVSEDENYSVAQFPRSINPAFRSSSPQPSMFESHHDPNSMLANNLAHREPAQSSSRETTVTPQKPPPAMRNSMDEPQRGQQTSPQYDTNHYGPLAAVPHDPYPVDGMTMLCRTGPVGPPSDRGSHTSSARPSSGASYSDCSNPTSMSSVEPPSGKTSPVKQDMSDNSSPEKSVLKKKSGFFQNHSPFRRKSTRELRSPPQTRNTWHSANNPRGELQRTTSPEPIDANASLALGVGQNVLPVTTPETQKRSGQFRGIEAEQSDPIAMALAELKDVNLGKQSSVRMSADHYHGIATPAPGAEPRSARPNGREAPPSYNNQAAVSRLGVPPPAVTSRAMKEATKKATDHTRSVFGNAGHQGNSPVSRPSTRGHDMPRATSPAPPRAAFGNAGHHGNSPVSRPSTRGHDMPRATSPAPPRAAFGIAGHRGASPASRPATRGNDMPRAVSPVPTRGPSPQPRIGGDQHYRSASPNPYNGHHRNGSQVSMSQQRGPDQRYQRAASPHGSARGASPASFRGEYDRPHSSYGGSDMAVQLAPVGSAGYGSQRGRAVDLYDGGSRPRSKSVADPSRQYTRDGRPILHFARALYMYQAVIPEELGFGKGDFLAVLRHQDDGWWEAEVHNGDGRIGLDTLEETARMVSSKSAQRAAVNVVLLVSTAASLFALASLATALFFQNFVPDQFITTPVFLQYQSGVNPYGVVPLAYPPPKLNQDYDVSVTLSMPRSPPNTERGNFMVSLYLVREGGKGHQTLTTGRRTAGMQQYLDSQKVLFQSRRPALMPYEDPIFSVAKRVLFLGYYLLFPRAQSRIMTIQLAERVNFDKAATKPTTALVEIEAGQHIQIYETALTLTAQLRGLRWLMFHYRLLTYMTFTSVFWVCEVLFMCLAWVVWSTIVMSKSSTAKANDASDAEDDDYSDRPASSNAPGKQVAIKKEVRLKLEDSDDQERAFSDIPMLGAEADDEDDFDDDDSGIAGDKRIAMTATSYKGERSENIRRRASRNVMD